MNFKKGVLQQEVDLLSIYKELEAKNVKATQVGQKKKRLVSKWDEESKGYILVKPKEIKIEVK